MNMKTYHAQEKFSKENPEWAAAAMAAINRWGRGEATIMHAVGEALKEAYENGRNGVAVVAPPPKVVSRVIRRSR